MQYSVVMPCAGIGARMGLGYNKLLLKMKNGKTVLENTLSIFLNDRQCVEIILVVGQNDLETIQNMVKHPLVRFVMGGKTRQESVYHGLLAVSHDYVLIHDGARPFLKQASIDALLACLSDHEACLLMVPAKDTMKVVKDGQVVLTPDRATMYQAQTPQAFQTKIVLDAFKEADKQGFIGTDDASVIEAMTKTKVQVVLGDYDNIKITTPEDLKYDTF